jgi:hypothetical protein
MGDVHTLATFAFAQMRRDPAFRAEFPWVRDTVVCVESDRMDDVLSGQMAHYFPGGGTIACYYPDDHRFMFVRVDAPGQATGAENLADGECTDDGRLVVDDKDATLTIGMVVDTIYRDNNGDYSHLPTFERHVGVASTVEVEKALSFA